MKYVSTRKGIEATAPETVFQGLAPDGGLYVPVVGSDRVGVGSSRVGLGSDRVGVGSVSVGVNDSNKTLNDTNQTLIDPNLTLCKAEDFVLSRLFGDFPEEVRKSAIDRLSSRFPAEDPVPLVEKDGLYMLELFHGKTGAFKDVALSMLPVFMRHAAGGRRVLVLTATSGDTGSAAMQGFAGVDGTEIIVFYPATGTSRIQRLQMTTPGEPNVHAVGIRGNFDDAQAAVKRIFADEAIRAEAAKHGITLSSANSINTGRLVPQIAYYVLAGAKLVGTDGGSGAPAPQPKDGIVFDVDGGSGAPAPLPKDGVVFDVVVPSGNFGNILAAYYAKLLGTPIRKFIVGSNVNDVLARFVKTGVYDPGPNFTVTNSPSMDIRKSSNVERLLWMISGGLDGDIERACAETTRMMKDLAEKGRYELSESAKERLFADFEGGVATPEETEAEMRRMREAAGYLVDPHTAVATCVAKKLGLPRDGVPCVVAATATPYKFPETCLRAYGEDVLVAPPPSVAELDKLPVAQTRVCDVAAIDQEVTRLF
ncbi:MAG: threonine synthase [Kiritimatiellae bacterium]|nr:threonine synthase [Kiritimatiellia bacterium]